MVARSAPKATGLSDERRCRFLLRGQTQQSNAPVATDSFGRLRCQRRPAKRRRLQSDAKIAYGKASSRSLHGLRNTQSGTLHKGCDRGIEVSVSLRATEARLAPRPPGFQRIKVGE